MKFLDAGTGTVDTAIILTELETRLVQNMYLLQNQIFSKIQTLCSSHFHTMCVFYSILSTAEVATVYSALDCVVDPQSEQ